MLAVGHPRAPGRACRRGRPRPPSGSAPRGTRRPSSPPRQQRGRGLSGRPPLRQTPPAARPASRTPSREGEELGGAAGTAAEAEVLTHRDAVGRRAARSAHAPTNSSAVREAKSRSKGITTSSLTPSPAITSRLIWLTGSHHELGSCVGVDHRLRVRIEGEDGVVAPDHLPVSDMDAVEGPDRHPPRLGRGSTSVSGDDLHAGANTTTGWSSAVARLGDGHKLALDASSRTGPVRRPPCAATARPWLHGPRLVGRRAARSREEGERVARAATSRSRVRRPPDGTAPMRRALELLAVGVAQVGDQRAHVGARRSTRSRTRARSPSCDSSSAR